MYDKYTFPKNVKIFKGLEAEETEHFNIYGYGFTDFFDKGIDLNKINLPKNGKKNILVMHADLDGMYIQDNKKAKEGKYNPISKKELEEKGFDYVALGHVHKSNFSPLEKVIYPGSFMQYRFSEDSPGVVLGEFKKAILYSLGDKEKKDGFRQSDDEKLHLEHFDLDNQKYIELTIDVTTSRSIQELINQLLLLKLEKRNYYKIILIGEKKFEINPRYIISNLEEENIIKISDNTKLSLDIQELAKENSLRGVSIKKALEKLEEIKRDTEISEQEKIQKSLNIEKTIEIILEEMRN